LKNVEAIEINRLRCGKPILAGIVKLVPKAATAALPDNLRPRRGA